MNTNASTASSSTPPSPGSSMESKTAWMTAVTAFAGVMLGVLASSAQHWITYQGIERPKLEIEMKKIDLESKKTAIEAHKQVLSLTPSLAVACNAESIDKWTWKVMCNAKNLGTYHVDVALGTVKVSLSSDTKEVLYESGGDFVVDIPNKKSRFRAPPGSAGDLWFYVTFERGKYKDGVHAGLVARVDFTFSTISTATAFVSNQFPDLEAFVKDAATNGTNILVTLPPPRAD